MQQSLNGNWFIIWWLNKDPVTYIASFGGLTQFLLQYHANDGRLNRAAMLHHVALLHHVLLKQSGASRQIRTVINRLKADYSTIEL